MTNLESQLRLHLSLTTSTLDRIKQSVQEGSKVGNRQQIELSNEGNWNKGCTAYFHWQGDRHLLFCLMCGGLDGSSEVERRQAVDMVVTDQGVEVVETYQYHTGDARQPEPRARGQTQMLMHHSDIQRNFVAV